MKIDTINTRWRVYTPEDNTPSEARRRRRASSSSVERLCRAIVVSRIACARITNTHTRRATHATHAVKITAFRCAGPRALASRSRTKYGISLNCVACAHMCTRSMCIIYIVYICVWCQQLIIIGVRAWRVVEMHTRGSRERAYSTASPARENAPRTDGNTCAPARRRRRRRRRRLN